MRCKAYGSKQEKHREVLSQITVRRRMRATVTIRRWRLLLVKDFDLRNMTSATPSSSSSRQLARISSRSSLCFSVLRCTSVAAGVRHSDKLRFTRACSHDSCLSSSGAVISVTPVAQTVVQLTPAAAKPAVHPLAPKEIQASFDDFLKKFSSAAGASVSSGPIAGAIPLYKESSKPSDFEDWEAPSYLWQQREFSDAEIEAVMVSTLTTEGAPGPLGLKTHSWQSGHCKLTLQSGGATYITDGP